MFWRYFVAGIFAPVVTTAQFINRLTVDECVICCTTASNEFGGVNFNVGNCNDGCRRATGRDQLCSDLFGNNVADPARLGCEIGRDFLSTGVTPLLNPGEIVQCDRFANLAVVNLVLPDPSSFLVGENDCTSCCDKANDEFDKEGDNADDFALDTCSSTCTDPAFCFDEPGHRERAGCLVALDFLSQAVTTIGAQIVTCDNVGNIADFPLTEFPTNSPTTRPTSSPTNRPSVAPTSSPIVLEETDFLIIAAAGGAGGFLLISACLCLVFRSKRKTAENKFSLDGTSFSDLGKVVIRIEVPASEAAKEDFDISKFIPGQLRKGSNQDSSTGLTPVLTPVQSPRKVMDHQLVAHGDVNQNTHPRYHLSTTTVQDNPPQQEREQYPSTQRFPKSWQDDDKDLSGFIDRPPTF